MISEPPTGNQLDIEPKEYLYHKNGFKKAVLVHIANNGECTSCWENKGNYFSDGLKIYRIIDSFGTESELK